MTLECGKYIVRLVIYCVKRKIFPQINADLRRVYLRQDND